MNASEHKRTLRIPLDLDRRIREMARQSGRSVHAEILFRLEKSLQEPVVLERDGESGGFVPRPQNGTHQVREEGIPYDLHQVIERAVTREVNRRLQGEIDAAVRRVLRDMTAGTDADESERTGS